MSELCNPLPTHLAVQRFQPAIRAREHVLGLIAHQLADGGLADADAFGDLLLREPRFEQVHHDLPGFHFDDPHGIFCLTSRNMQAGLNGGMRQDLDNLDTLGKRLKHARKSRGMTQEQLAEASGVNQPLISKIERNQVGATAAAIKLAQALRVSPIWLDQWIEPMELPSTQEPAPPAYAPANIDEADWLLLQGAKLVLGQEEQKRLQRVGALTQQAAPASSPPPAKVLTLRPKRAGPTRMEEPIWRKTGAAKTAPAKSKRRKGE
jgi:transcriptional regulator with XRE-family HTH domain